MAVMATINKDGSPHLSPNWYYYDGERLSFVTTKERLKFFNLRRDDRMAVPGFRLCGDSGPGNHRRRRYLGRRAHVIRRYVEADQVDDYVERWKTQPRILVKITPDKIYTRF